MDDISLTIKMHRVKIILGGRFNTGQRRKDAVAKIRSRDKRCRLPWAKRGLKMLFKPKLIQMHCDPDLADKLAQMYTQQIMDTRC